MSRLPSMSFALIAAASLFCITGCGANADSSAVTASGDDLTAKNSGVFMAVSNEVAGGDIANITSVKLANGSKTRCAEGDTKKTCDVIGLDFSALHLSANKQEALDKAFRSGRALLQGKLGYDKANALTHTEFPGIVVTAAWESVSGQNIAEGDVTSLYLVNDITQSECLNGCNHAREETVNSSANEEILGVDFDDVGASKTELTAATNAMKIGAAGLYVVGINQGVVGGKIGNQAPTFFTLRAADFFLPFH